MPVAVQRLQPAARLLLHREGNMVAVGRLPPAVERMPAGAGHLPEAVDHPRAGITN